MSLVNDIINNTIEPDIPWMNRDNSTVHANSTQVVSLCPVCNFQHEPHMTEKCRKNAKFEVRYYPGNLPKRGKPIKVCKQCRNEELY